MESGRRILKIFIAVEMFDSVEIFEDMFRI